MLSRLRRAVVKVADLLSRTQGASLDTMREILIEADIGVTYTDLILKAVAAAKNDRQQALKDELIRLLSIPKPPEPTVPRIIMVSGVNGSGKTTTAAKLAYLYEKEARVICACADTYRDAASEQLAVWAQRAGVEIVTSQKGQDAAAVVFDTIARARAQNIETVVIDTAGRLHTRRDLMEELKKIERVITKLKDTGPDLNILTIDANLGQNSIQQAKVFTATIGINSLILTKFDGTAKGGAIIPICNELSLPVLYLGVGEGVDDILEFEPHAFVEALFA
jgi:fused signal recognition particle receptor